MSRPRWYRTHATEPPQSTDVLGLWVIDGQAVASVCWRDRAGMYRIPVNGDRTPPPVQPPRWWQELPAPPKGWDEA